MSNSPKSLDHPAFGPCELVPTLVAVKWAAPMKAPTVKSALTKLKLSAATGSQRSKRTVHQASAGRELGDTLINNSETLTWAAGNIQLAASQERIATDSNIEWVGPVYQSKGASGGVRSYFAINPTVLVLAAEAAAALGELRALDDSIVLDEARTALLKPFVVFKLPKGNALEFAERLRESATLQQIAKGLKFENIPYVSPTCTNSPCAAPGTRRNEAGRCSPATVASTPNDPLFANQWGVQRINAPHAWPITQGDPKVVIAVIDEGVDLGHPDLNLWPVSYSTITQTNDGSSVGSHGTACAGIIAAKMDNGLGVSGLASNCPVMAIATNFSDTEVAEGLRFAADNGARVVSLSFGFYKEWMVWDFSIIEPALQYCHDKNVVLVAAAGNEDQPVCRFPASDPRTIAVGGSTREDVRKRIGDASADSGWGACYGPDLDVVAPCIEIPTTDRLGTAGYTASDYNLAFNGTSSATPHVAALAGLLLSVNPRLTNTEVRKIISETTDKINPSGYAYVTSPGKPYGTWNFEVGYGRINVERAVLLACSLGLPSDPSGPCSVELAPPDPCCIGPCDVPWRTDEQCVVWYENKLYRAPITGERTEPASALSVTAPVNHIEFRITYEHKLCLLGKQLGPLLFTTTLLPGETLKIYQSDRYRRITSAEQRYSVQTTFMQFLSLVHQARASNSVDVLNERLSSAHSTSASGTGGGFFFGLVGWGGTGSGAASSTVSSHTALSVQAASELFHQSVQQASQLTHAERSVVLSTYEEAETKDITMRTLQNLNECRAVTYFVRQVFELYATNTLVTELAYRIVAQGVPADWHAVDDLGWLPPGLQETIKKVLKLLPVPGQIVVRPKPISLPTDGVVYNPELAHCCSCEPERKAAISIRLEKEKAEALRACVEVQTLELELQRRKLLLQKGQLDGYY